MFYVKICIFMINYYSLRYILYCYCLNLLRNFIIISDGKNSLFLGIELNRICLKEDKYYNI